MSKYLSNQIFYRIPQHMRWTECLRLRCLYLSNNSSSNNNMPQLNNGSLAGLWQRSMKISGSSTKTWFFRLVLWKAPHLKLETEFWWRHLTTARCRSNGMPHVCRSLRHQQYSSSSNNLKSFFALQHLPKMVKVKFITIIQNLCLFIILSGKDMNKQMTRDWSIRGRSNANDYRDSNERSTPKSRDSKRRSRSTSRSPSRKRSRSPQSSPRRRTRVTPRYSVQIPKVSLDW